MGCEKISIDRILGQVQHKLLVHTPLRSSSLLEEDPLFARNLTTTRCPSSVRVAKRTCASQERHRIKRDLIRIRSHRAMIITLPAPYHKVFHFSPRGPFKSWDPTTADENKQLETLLLPRHLSIVQNDRAPCAERPRFCYKFDTGMQSGALPNTNHASTLHLFWRKQDQRRHRHWHCFHNYGCFRARRTSGINCAAKLETPIYNNCKTANGSIVACSLKRATFWLISLQISFHHLRLPCRLVESLPSRCCATSRGAQQPHWARCLFAFWYQDDHLTCSKHTGFQHSP